MTDYKKKIDVLFKDLSPDTPGAALLAAKGNRILYERGFGSANLDYKIPISPRTTFNLMSISKPLTATAIMFLQQENKINIDDELVAFFPELKKYYRGVTIKHLLQHTSGMPSKRIPWLLHDKRGNAGNNDILQAMCHKHPKLNFKPGTKYEYSNLGYIFLALLIERTTGNSISRAMKKILFGPFNMRDSIVFSENKPIVQNRASAYGKWQKPVDRQKYTCYGFEAYLTVGDGGIYSSVKDLFNYWLTLMSGAIISEKSREQMFSDLVPRGRTECFAELLSKERYENFYGYGWGVIQYNHLTKIIFHSGSGGGFRNLLTYYPKNDLLIVLLTNFSTYFSKNKRSEMTEKIFKIIVSNEK